MTFGMTPRPDRDRASQDREQSRRAEFAPPVGPVRTDRSTGIAIAVVTVVWLLTTLGIIGGLASEHSRMDVACPTADGYYYRDATWSWLPPGPVCHPLSTSAGSPSPPSDWRYLMVVGPWIGLAITVSLGRRWWRTSGRSTDRPWWRYRPTATPYLDRRGRPRRIPWRIRLAMDHPIASALMAGGFPFAWGLLVGFALWICVLFGLGFGLLDLWSWRVPDGWRRRAHLTALARRDEQLLREPDRTDEFLPSD